MDHDPLPSDHPETERVSTGVLPPDTNVQALITAGYERYLQVSRDTTEQLADLRRQYDDMQAEEECVTAACQRLAVKIDAFRAANEATEAAYTAAEAAAEAASAEVIGKADADAEGADSAAGQQS